MSADEELSFHFLAENSSDLVCRAALDMTLQYVSPTAFALLGWDAQELVGRSLNSLVAGEEIAPIDSAGQPFERPPVTLNLHKKDGSSLWMEMRRRMVVDRETGEPRGYVLVLRDTGRYETLEAQSVIALPPRVPGLSSYSEFLKDLEREWSRAQREGLSLSLLRLDFNGFRQLHFLDGHRVGDDCLARAAAAIRGLLRLTDFAAQYMAEDILLLLPSTDGPSAAKVAAKVRSTILGLRSPRSLEGQAWVAVSIGMATVTARSAGNLQMPDLLLLSAEHALRRAQQKEAESLRHVAAYSAQSSDWKKSMPGTPPRYA